MENGGIDKMSNIDVEEVTVQEGKKPRNEFRLPNMYFVAMDDWVDKLGEKAFIAWMKLYTMCDRSKDRLNKENDMVPYSLAKVMEKLGIKSRTTLNATVLKPLYEFGLIDLVESLRPSDQKRSTTPLNIVVYEYPANEFARVVKPLEKVADWNTRSKHVEFGKRGGFHKHTKEEQPKEQPKKKKYILNRTVQKIGHWNSVSKKLNTKGSKNWRVSVQKIEPNNESNLYLKESNTIFKESNKSSSSSKVVNIQNRVKKKEDEEEKIMNVIYQNDFYLEMILRFDQEQFCTTRFETIEIVKRLMKKKVESFPMDAVVEAIKKVKEQALRGNIETAPHVYFPSVLANEIVNQKLSKQALKEKVEREAQWRAANPEPLPFYNWLEQDASKVPVPEAPKQYGTYDQSQASDDDVSFI